MNTYYERGRLNFVFSFGSVKSTGDTFRLGLPLDEIDMVALLVTTEETLDRVVFDRGVVFSVSMSITELVIAVLRLYGVLETSSEVFALSNGLDSTASRCLRETRRLVTNFSFNGVLAGDLSKESNGVLLARMVDGFSSSVELELKKVEGRSFSLFESTFVIVDSYVEVTNEICSILVFSFSSSLSSFIVFKSEAVEHE